jgi:integrase
MDFKEEIKKTKPHISDGTIKTYNSLLKTIYKNVFDNDDKPDIKKFSDTKNITIFLETKPYNVRKTYLSALVSITNNEDYKNMMLNDIKEYNENIDKSVMTDKLKESEITTDEIESLNSKLKTNAELLMKKQNHSINDLMEIENYIIFCLYHGYIQPRRSLDFCLMKYKNYTNEDNYIDLKKSKMTFNRFKTDKFKGQQVIDIPIALKKILTKWINIIPDDVDYLLFNKKKEPLTAITMTQRLNAVFGGKKSVNSLRHYYLTNKYKSLMIENEKMEKDMDLMGSSKKQENVYIKIHEK